MTAMAGCPYRETNHVLYSKKKSKYRKVNTEKSLTKNEEGSAKASDLMAAVGGGHSVHQW
jgi:hypothetical protein